jgi:hypothetical protein
MDTLEQLYIQQHQYNTLTPEQNSWEHNPLFEIASDIQLRHAVPEKNTHMFPTPISLLPNTETHTRPTQVIP